MVYLMMKCIHYYLSCNNGNTILDATLSFERYSKYFSSLYMYDIGIAGPDLNEKAIMSDERYIN